MRTLLIATALELAIVLPAAAQHPLMHPSRDVVVEYQTSGNTGGPPGETAPHRVRMYFADHGMKMRIEGEGQPGYAIIDRSTNHMIMVMVQQHMYMDVPFDPKRVMAFDNPEGTFTRRGTDTVAGYSCTVYDATTPQHHGQVCVTRDGVLLRAKSEGPGQHGELLALSVTYGAQSPDLFEPPAGFQKFDASHMGPGMAPMGPGGPPRQ
jgi:hypothetical protein